MAEYYASETGRALPLRFQTDLNSKTLHLICRVVIKSVEPIYLSTHNLNFDGKYYKPLLLKNPIIKQSVGLEDGKFKISTLRLSVSNFEYGGEIFSDILQDTPLINKKAFVFFQTQTAKTSDDTLEVYVGEIRKIEHTSSTVEISIEDYTQHKTNIQLPKEIVDAPSVQIAHVEKYRGKPIPMVYGHVLKAPAVIDLGGIIKADTDDGVELVTNNIGDYEVIGNDYYYSDVENEVFDNEIIHPMWVFSGSSYVNIMIKGNQDLPHTRAALGLNELGGYEVTGSFIGVQQYKDEGSGKLTFSPNFLMQHNVMQGVWYGKAGKVSLTKRTSGGVTYTGDDTTGFDNPDNFGEDINNVLSDGDYNITNILDSNGFEPNHTWTYNYIDYPLVFVNQNLMRMRIENKPDYNGYGFNSQIAINGHRMPFLKDIHSMPSDVPLYVVGRDFTGVSAAIADGSLFIHVNIAILDGSGGIEGQMDDYSTDTDISEWGFDKIFAFPSFESLSSYAGIPSMYAEEFATLILFDDVDTDLFPEKIPYIQIWNDTNAGVFDIYFGVSGGLAYIGTENIKQITGILKGSLAEIDMKTVIDVKDALTSNIYLNIDGRKAEDGSRLTNAIAILRDIAIQEMNLIADDIDTDSYEDALGNNDINLAFSVNKFINAKDLFEEISGSTMCFPYFKSNGKLGFPIIKDDYEVEDYNDAISINREDVINYSFSKTPLEKVYTRVDVKYQIDYETGEYLSLLKGVDGMSEEHLAYYGYEDIEENILIYESKYIRELEYAEKLQKRLFYYHRNQHLKAKLKLPLKYIAIEVGSIISFNKLIEDRLAYGDNYLKFTWGENEGLGFDGIISPMFFVNSVTIASDYIQIEATQLHWLKDVDNMTEWENIGLIADLVIEEEEEEPEELELINTFNINQESLNPFHTIDELYNQDIQGWFGAMAFGLSSFNSLLPTDWSTYSNSGIKNYQALVFEIKTVNDDVISSQILALENISESYHVEDFELAWTLNGYAEGEPWEAWFSSDTLNIARLNQGSSPHSQTYHTLSIGDGLKKALNENLLAFNELSFEASLDIQLWSEEYGLGDINADGTLNILDIVTLLPFVVYANQDEMTNAEFNASDINQDGVVNILDIVQMVNIILYGDTAGGG